jgi:hypothetical protein
MTMRKAPLLAGLALVLGVPGVRAQDAPRDVRVAIPAVEVRSGPSPQYYATSKLQLNDMVTIVKVLDGGWLAIKPPKGSFNWINGAFLDQPVRPGGTAPVNAEATLLIGSALVNAPPTARSPVKAPKGAQVTILGEPMTDTEGKWWPIQPLPRELRYLPAIAVQGTPPVQPGLAAAPPVRPPGSSLPPVTPTQVINDPLWLQAEQAEHDNNLALAIGLYIKLSRQPTTDEELRLRCMNRIDALNQKLRASASASVNTHYPPSAGADPRLPPASGVNQPPSAALPPPTLPTAPPGTVPMASGQFSAAPAGQAPAPLVPSRVTGRLRLTWIQRDNKFLYALETEQNELLMYVAETPTLSLKPYVGYRLYEFQGTQVYDGVLKRNLLTVTGVTPLP